MKPRTKTREPLIPRCRYCKRILWPWQRQHLGLDPAHSGCDVEAFSKALLTAGFTGPEYFRQLDLRRTQANE